MKPYPKNKAIGNLENTAEFLQFSLLAIALISDENAVPIDSVQKITMWFGSDGIDLTAFAEEFIKDRKNQRRLISTQVKLIGCAVSMACNTAEKFYTHQNPPIWNTKKWQPPYPYAYQIRNMCSHGFFWVMRESWVKKYEENGGCFPIQYRGLRIEKPWNNQESPRKATLGDISPVGDMFHLINDIIQDIRLFNTPRDISPL